MTRFTWTSERVRRALGVAGSGSSPRDYSGISTDTRTLEPGELFVALRGEKFDGTEFVSAAADAGAGGAVVERRPKAVLENFELFEVEDALHALGVLAAARRTELDATVVAITGSSGKTTTRQFTAAALGGATYASPGNFNNLVGLPLSILSAPEDSPVWVLELASNQPGEIERLGRIANADVGVITSVSESHLEGLGDLQGVLDEKLSLLSTVRPGARAFVADEPEALVRQARQRLSETETVGLSEAADVRPERWSTSSDGVAWTWQDVEFSLPGFGAHLIRNALFALAVARHLGVEPREAATRLKAANVPLMRGEIRPVGGIALLVDCYNANPASFSAAIEAQSSLGGQRRRAILAGTMLELGDRSAELHEQVAKRMLDAEVEVIAATGEFITAFRRLAPGSSVSLILKETLEAAYAELVTRLNGDEVVLLKASRGMKFERALPWFERDFGPRETVINSGTDG
jgi:UDP-N-acetylmuramoyl-tripeptide--D-alanyl-D-alanine ligase